jgi:hypothetical protein
MQGNQLVLRIRCGWWYRPQTEAAAALGRRAISIRVGMRRRICMRAEHLAGRWRFGGCRRQHPLG